ncbi:MAG: magnesium-protoporphyrin IX monomethyl ester anaerobic oxidative cyclase [Zoogloeaceae bacterium]|jgi:anaerobic magnesium-protoporphyrin IX monomethyl ester cyclase|nr:magnesium-protoporphyrin IX monomethyl ester anaerobic oxidative cyclase [Zoogloeaceae bacterium]
MNARPAMPLDILLVNPPHTAIGSRLAGEHLPPLGLLCVGGPLLDAGFPVSLLDADLENLDLARIVARVLVRRPNVALIGHSGSSSAHLTIVALCRRLKAALPELRIIYGGVYPTYHWREILRETPEIDCVVRGEGEQTTLSLVTAMARGEPLETVRGIALRQAGEILATPPAAVISRLDDYRVGWELIEHARYSYWGGRRAVVAQFSRGCPHQCEYCGQRGFWQRWRHRDPQKFARELAWLYREKGVELINFADELPTGSRKAWKAFLEALIAENVPLTLVGSTRASDIVRDADLLPLYRKAGVIRFLLGIESYDETTLAAIRKGANPRDDALAIRLLRQHGIVAMATCVVGFAEERDRDYWRSLRQLLAYDPDQIQLIHATPHRWTAFYQQAEQRRVLETDTRRWDYKHQVLAVERVPSWRVFLWCKLIEVALQLRPRALWRVLLHPDAEIRHAMRWYTRIGRRVWLHEILEFLFATRHLKNGPTLEKCFGPAFDLADGNISSPSGGERSKRRRGR